MIEQHLPILQVLVPLLSALLAVLLRARRPVGVLSLAAAWATFGISVALVGRVLHCDQNTNKTIRHPLEPSKQGRADVDLARIRRSLPSPWRGRTYRLSSVSAS